jgi:hypothetical protein
MEGIKKDPDAEINVWYRVSFQGSEKEGVDKAMQMGGA